MTLPYYYNNNIVVISLQIIGQRDQLGASNILMNDLNYDLSMFKSLEDLEVRK